MKKKPTIAMGFKCGGENGGPYISHKRIMESTLGEKYNIVPLYFPEGRMGVFCPGHIKQVRQEIRRINPEIVQIPGLQLLGFHMMIAAILEKRKTVLVVHGSSIESTQISRAKKFVLNLLEDYSLRKATCVYGVSEYVRSWAKLRKYKDKCFGTIYNLVQEKKSTPKDIRKELNIDDKDIVIVSTGRVVREKGYDTLLDVLEKMELPNNVKLVVAGDGDYLQKMRERISQNGLSNQVFLLGYREDVDNILRAGDFFVLLTLHETLSISLLEACQHGLPCVATKVGGVPEVVKNNYNGFLVEPRDLEAIQEVIWKLIRDIELRRKMSENARLHIKQTFATEKILEQLDSMYQMLLNGDLK